MGKIAFVLGGARSGKSNLALKLAMDSGKKVTFIATCPYYDDEMQDRIQKHKDERPEDWGCFEEFKDIAKVIRDISENYNYELVLIDCMTLFTSNLMMDKIEETAIKARVESMLEEIKKSRLEAVIVSNEVGMGLVPETTVGRKFRDIAGRVNQQVAAIADDVYFVVAGIANKIK